MGCRRFLFAWLMMAKEKYDSSRRVYVAVVSDLHIGSTVALCPPDGIALEDGGTYQPSQIQKWLWQKWTQYWADVKQAVGMSPLIVVVNGEFCDGNHHQTSQIATPSETQMIDAAIGVMSKPATMAKELYVTIGTRVHSGAGGGFDHLIAKELGRELILRRGAARSTVCRFKSKTHCLISRITSAAAHARRAQGRTSAVSA